MSTQEHNQQRKGFLKDFREKAEETAFSEWPWTRLNGLPYYIWRNGIVLKAFFFFIGWCIAGILIFNPNDYGMEWIVVLGVIPCLWLGRRSAQRSWARREKRYLEENPGVAPIPMPTKGALWDPAFPWLRRRYLAHIADALLSVVPALLILLTRLFFLTFHSIVTIGFEAARTEFTRGREGAALFFYLILLIVPGCIPHAIFIPLCKRTPGMWLFGLSITCEDGRRLNPWQAFVRYWRMSVPTWIAKGRYDENGRIDTATSDWDVKKGYKVSCSLVIHHIAFILAIVMGITSICLALDCTESYDRYLKIFGEDQTPLDRLPNKEAINPHDFLLTREQMYMLYRNGPWGTNSGDPDLKRYYGLLTAYLLFSACTMLPSVRRVPRTKVHLGGDLHME